MRIRVIADDATAFQAWVAQQKRVPTAPREVAQQRGLYDVTNMACANCHRIEGTSAQGEDWARPDAHRVSPDAGGGPAEQFAGSTLCVAS